MPARDKRVLEPFSIGDAVVTGTTAAVASLGIPDPPCSRPSDAAAVGCGGRRMRRPSS
jgi:hypothetical protein